MILTSTPAAHRADVEAAFAEMAEVFFCNAVKVVFERVSQLLTFFCDAFGVAVGAEASAGAAAFGDGLGFGAAGDSLGFGAAAITGPTPDG